MMTAFGFLAVALARPSYGYRLREIHAKGADILFAVDVSRSMLCTDIAPNRLTRAKMAAKDMLAVARGHRIGVIPFSREAFLQCPLTLDENAVMQSLDAIGTTNIPKQGTSLAEPIAEARKAFASSGENKRILVLFTDGEDLEGNGLAEARETKDMIIVTVGTGTVQGAPVPVSEEEGSGYIKDASGGFVTSRLDSGALESVASATNGLYGHVTSPALPAQFKELINRDEQEANAEATNIRIPLIRYRWPLAAALVLLIAEAFIPAFRRKGGATLLALLLFLPATPDNVAAADTTPSVQQAPAQDAPKNVVPVNPREGYNKGVEFFNAGDYRAAVKAFAQAADHCATSPDELKKQIHGNAGAAKIAEVIAALPPNDAPLPQQSDNAARELLKSAKTDIEKALSLAPADELLRKNFQLIDEVLAELDRRQKQAQNAPQQKKKEPPKPDEEKKKDDPLPTPEHKEEPPPPKEKEKGNNDNCDKNQGDSGQNQDPSKSGNGQSDQSQGGSGGSDGQSGQSGQNNQQGSSGQNQQQQQKQNQQQNPQPQGGGQDQQQPSQGQSGQNPSQPDSQQGQNQKPQNNSGRDEQPPKEKAQQPQDEKKPQDSDKSRDNKDQPSQGEQPQSQNGANQQQGSSGANEQGGQEPQSSAGEQQQQPGAQQQGRDKEPQQSPGKDGQSPKDDAGQPRQGPKEEPQPQQSPQGGNKDNGPKEQPSQSEQPAPQKNGDKQQANEPQPSGTENGQSPQAQPGGKDTATPETGKDAPKPQAGSKAGGDEGAMNGKDKNRPQPSATNQAGVDKAPAPKPQQGQGAQSEKAAAAPKPGTKEQSLAGGAQESATAKAQAAGSPEPQREGDHTAALARPGEEKSPGDKTSSAKAAAAGGPAPEGQEGTPVYAPGAMTPTEAEQLLKILQDDEKLLPAGQLRNQRKDNTSGRDW
jgi:Ca-activated chloride channel family protein